eukprot:CAMPEP_0178629528 /NCGR_PEP_ID=MMETSP0698-20121128/9997_1 /TAXON_ID=265572 /ORGANISM="Extubocellulus spinifer, Strain CCMP396" /LENGTH=41 /DNA_ID= /DNA_START= /DNA_END= /DNA_ORIENTATION=
MPKSSALPCEKSRVSVASRLLMKKAGILCRPPVGGGGWADP